MTERQTRIIWGVGILVVCAIFLAPVAAMLSGSFRGLGQAPPRTLELLPASPSLDGYRAAFSLVSLARSILNSLVVAMIAVPLTIFTAAAAGYGISQLEPRRRAIAVGALLVVLTVPVSALWLTRFALFKTIGATDSFVPLIAPAILGGSPIFVLLYFLGFRRLPPDLLDAARIEGAPEWHIWRRIALPLVRSTTIAVALLAFALFWGNFIDPLLYLTSESRFTAPLALRSLQQLDRTNWPVMLAGSVVVAAPVLVTFALALRRIAPRRGTGWL